MEMAPLVLDGLKSNQGATKAGRRQGHQQKIIFHHKSCSMERELPHEGKHLSLERNWISSLISGVFSPFLLKSPQKPVVQHLMCGGDTIVASVNFDNTVTGSEYPSRVNLSAVS